MLANLVVFLMFGFDVILKMDQLASNYVSVDCFKNEVVFKPPEEEEFWFIECRIRSFPPIIYAVQVKKLLQNGCHVFLAWVIEKLKEKSKLEDNPIVKEYPEVLPKHLLGLPPEREVEFTIELVLGTTPISMAPYIMTPSKTELKEQL